MTVGATRNLFGRAETVVFPVVTFHVGFDCHVEDFVALHHLYIAVALQADFGVELTVGVIVRTTHRFYFVQIVAVVAGCRISISCSDSFPVYRFLIHSFSVMALNALGYNNALVIFPIRMCMNIGMTVGAADTLGNVDTGIMFRILTFVAALALDLLDFDLPLHMLGEIGDIHVAAGAGVFAVNRCGKVLDREFVAVASQAGSRIYSHALLSAHRLTGKGNGEKNYQ